MNRHLMLLPLALFFLATAMVAAADAPAVQTLNGTLIDNMCADAHADDLAAFVATHEKSCATAAACMASGYSLVVDGKLWPLDAASNDRAAAFLKIKTSTLRVVVQARVTDGKLHIESIENAPASA